MQLIVYSTTNLQWLTSRIEY